MEDPELDEGEEQFRRVATESHMAREHRLTAGRGALERAVADADVTLRGQS